MSILIAPRWQALATEALGLMSSFSNIVRTSYERDHDFLPDLHRARTIGIFSDYSGDHRGASFHAFSFLFANLDQSVRWEMRRRELRALKLPDGRRMSYKNLGDKRRQEALGTFLTAADAIPGFAVAILVSKRIPSLFHSSGKLDMESVDLGDMRHWRPAVLERLLRVVHFASFFLAGLSRGGQNAVWVSDEDAIAQNPIRVREVTRLFGNISSHYLQHQMAHFRFGTAAAVDDGSRAVEDLLSVPDLMAGALVEGLSAMYASHTVPRSTMVLPIVPRAAKATTILKWVAERGHSLRRAVYLIDKTPSGGLVIKHLALSAGSPAIFRRS